MNKQTNLIMTELPPDYDPQKDPIELVDYDAIWPIKANAEINSIQSLLKFPWLKDIQHIGSTAIPNIKAKPIIDIYVGIESLQYAPQAIALIKSLEYQAVVQYPDENKICLIKGIPPFGTKRTNHTHIVTYQGDHWNAAILFRDYLRTHPEEAKKYEQLKIELLKKFQFDREGYTAGKNEYVAKILNRVDFNKVRKR